MNEEDEAFNDIERQAKQRKEAVKAAVQTLSEYERGFIDGMQKQMQSSVDKAVNAMSQRTWVGLMRGVRVEGDTVVISVKGGNDAARELCGALIEEMNR